MRLNKSFLLLACALLATLIYTNFLTSVQAVPLAKNFDQFPTTIGNFRLVHSQTFSNEVIETAGMDQYLMNQYQDGDGFSTWLYIGYYEEQSQGSIIHSPTNCMPGSGWQYNMQPPQVVKDNHGVDYTINRVFLQKPGEKQLMHYWYHGRGRIVANEYIDRALMITDSILKRRSDGSLVRITGPMKETEIDIAKQEAFISNLIPLLNEFLPH